MNENCKRILSPSHSIVDFQTYGDENSKEIIILLHGYGQNCEEIQEQLNDILNPKYYWIIPNGLFPIPKKRRDSILYRYAWYFYNELKQKYYIDFNYPKEVLSNFINIIDPQKRDLTIIGYSQGGYLAPFLGQTLKQTKKVIGINCNYRSDMLNNNYNFSLYAIHGDQDEIVSYENSKNSFEKIRPLLTEGNFITVKDGRHSLTKDFITILKTLI